MPDNRAIYNAIERQRLPFIKKVITTAKAGLISQVLPVFTKLKDTQDIEATLAALDILIVDDPIRAIYTQIYREIGAHFFKLQERALEDKALKQEFEEVTFFQSVDTYLDVTGGTKIKGITNETRRIVGKELRLAIDQGLPVNQAAVNISQRASAINFRRAIVISRTEVIAASNFGQFAAAQASELTLNKVWLSALDDRTRDGEFDHVEADGQEVSQEQAFEVSREELMFPGDSSLGASAGNLINCRCGLAFQRIG